MNVRNDSQLNEMKQLGDFLDIEGENIQYNRLDIVYNRNTILADNTLVDTTERVIGEDVPVSGNELTFVSSARIMSIASTNINDIGITGTGIRTLLLIGCGIGGLEQTEVITMNGQTEVDSINQYTQINEMFGLTSGSNETNLGVIYCSDDTDTFTLGVPQNRVYDIMNIGHSLSKVGIFTVPLNKEMLIKRIVINSDATVAKPMRINMFRTFNNRQIQLLIGTYYLSTDFSMNLELDRTIASGDSIRLTAQNLGSTTIQVAVKLHTVLKNV